jgi:hypothetical protein
MIRSHEWSIERGAIALESSLRFYSTVDHQFNDATRNGRTG